MGNESIVRCPLCERVTAVTKHGSVQKLCHVNGLTWGDIGFSIGGWGQRRNYLAAFTGEVCEDCFTSVSEKINQLKDHVESIKGSRRDSILIYRTERAEGDQVPDMQQDELQSKRRGAGLLRLLPRFS